MHSVAHPECRTYWPFQVRRYFWPNMSFHSIEYNYRLPWIYIDGCKSSGSRDLWELYHYGPTKVFPIHRQNICFIDPKPQLWRESQDNVLHGWGRLQGSPLYTGHDLPWTLARRGLRDNVLHGGGRLQKLMLHREVVPAGPGQAFWMLSVHVYDDLGLLWDESVCFRIDFREL